MRNERKNGSTAAEESQPCCPHPRKQHNRETRLMHANCDGCLDDPAWLDRQLHVYREARPCPHMRAFIDFYAKSPVTLLSAPDPNTPILAACCECDNPATDEPVMIETGEVRK